MRRSDLIPAFVMLVVLLLVGAPAAQAQFARPGELPPIDAKTRAMVVDSVTAVIDSVYVLGEPAKRIVAGLRQYLEAGDYDELTDPAEFAHRLETDAQTINNDNHFSILAAPPLDPEFVEQEEDPREIERRKRFDRVHNYGFQKVEILPGGGGLPEARFIRRPRRGGLRCGCGRNELPGELRCGDHRPAAERWGRALDDPLPGGLSVC